MVVLSPQAVRLAVVLSTSAVLILASTNAHADASPEAGAVGVGVIHRVGTEAATRSHLVAWLRPAERLSFGAGLGHATTQLARSGLSVRVSAAADVPITDIGESTLLIEGGAVATLGVSNEGPVTTLGPAVRLVWQAAAEPIALTAGWSPEVQLLPDGGVFDAPSGELSLRLWF